MSRKLSVKGRSDDIALMRACYRIFFPEWEVEEFPQWLKDMEEGVATRMIPPSGSQPPSEDLKAQTGSGTTTGSC